jgi:hypothetical protein
VIADDLTSSSSGHRPDPTEFPIRSGVEKEFHVHTPDGHHPSTALPRSRRRE